MGSSMETDERLNEYRRFLISALRDHRAGQPPTEPGLLQVFLNHERVGTLDCVQGNHTWVCTSRERAIDSLDVRTEDGRLIGAFNAPEQGS